MKSPHPSSNGFALFSRHPERQLLDDRAPCLRSHDVTESIWLNSQLFSRNVTLNQKDMSSSTSVWILVLFNPHHHAGQPADVMLPSDITFCKGTSGGHMGVGVHLECSPRERPKPSYLWVTRTVVGRPTALPLSASMLSPLPAW